MAKKESPMIDPKPLRVNVMRLIDENRDSGLTVKDVADLLAGNELYTPYAQEEGYVFGWTKTMLETLAGEHLVELRNGRYFPV